MGVVAHEQKHEDDFYEVIWDVDVDEDGEPDGYVRNPEHNLDQDADSLRDEWEKQKYGDLSKGQSYFFETDQNHYAWSDDRADVAAKNAVNNHLSIDRYDWSDLDVSAGRIFIYKDEDEDQLPGSHAQKTNATKSGNNYHSD